jgi:alkanesulfonate monooxygenase
MARPTAQLRLGAFFNPTGHHVASWRHPQSQADAGINFKHYVEIAQTAERGKFDMIFLADNIGVREATWRRCRARHSTSPISSRSR